ncbi:MAG: hypothetical protein JWN84_1327 [Nocardioides sp.]|nr:hypothetical protein [Nocardioides sp.]
MAEARSLVGETGGTLGGRDLSAAAATTTYFSAIAVVPWLLLALWTTSWGVGADAAERRLLDLRVLVPDGMGARPSYDALVSAGTHLGVLGALVALLPASFYGEGLRRGALTLGPRDERFTGWRARLTLMPLLVVLPLLAWALLAVSDLLVPLAPEGGGGGAGDRVLRVLLGFTVTWLVVSVVLAWVFAVVMPGGPRPSVAAVGGLATGSFVAGFLHGFQLFLAIPVDVGIPFGGLGFVGGVVAVGLWLYLLHVVVLVGWGATTALERRASGRRAARS